MKLSAKLSSMLMVTLMVGCTTQPMNHHADTTQIVNPAQSETNTTMIEGHHLHVQSNVALQADPTLPLDEIAIAPTNEKDTSTQ